MVLASPILVESLGAKKSTVVSCFRQESPPGGSGEKVPPGGSGEKVKI